MSPKSEPTNLGTPRVCPIADALEVVGERWSLLVLRELLVIAGVIFALPAISGSLHRTRVTMRRAFPVRGSQHPLAE